MTHSQQFWAWHSGELDYVTVTPDSKQLRAGSVPNLAQNRHRSESLAVWDGGFCYGFCTNAGICFIIVGNTTRPLYSEQGIKWRVDFNVLWPIQRLAAPFPPVAPSPISLKLVNAQPVTNKSLLFHDHIVMTYGPRADPWADPSKRQTTVRNKCPRGDLIINNNTGDKNKTLANERGELLGTGTGEK